MKSPATCATLLAVCLLLLAGRTHAAPMTVTYQLTGGSYNGEGGGVITGGSVSFRADFAAPSGPATLLSFRITGTTGPDTLSPTALASANPGTLAGTSLFSAFAPPPSGTFRASWVRTFGLGGLYTQGILIRQFGGSTAAINITGFGSLVGTPRRVVIAAGREIAVPEPAADVLLLMGVAALALVGAASAVGGRSRPDL